MIDADIEALWHGQESAKNPNPTKPDGISPTPLEFLVPAFLEVMNEIGRYGHEKYGEFSFHHRAKLGDRSRGDHPRTTSGEICKHAQDHAWQYYAGTKHDHFGTLKHQLAAVAFNAMMEFYFAGLEEEKA